MWSTPVDLYCERVDPSFWAEPANALTNAAFLIAAVFAYMRWRREAKGDAASLALIVIVAAIALGSFAFHTLATRGAVLLDIVPITIFIYGYLVLALRRFLVIGWPIVVAVLVAFIAVSHGIAAFVPRHVLNGSTGYLPALAALLVLGVMVRGTPPGKAMLNAARVFALSIFLRVIDNDVCGAFPLGTHFAWHLLNALVLYILLRAAIAG